MQVISTAQDEVLQAILSDTMPPKMLAKTLAVCKKRDKTLTDYVSLCVALMTAYINIRDREALNESL